MDHEEFCIRPAGLLSNPLRPWISGTIAAAGVQSTVRFSVRPSTLIAIFLSLWLVLWFVGGVGLVVREHRRDRPLELVAMVPFGVCAIVYGIWVWNVRTAARNFQETLRRLARA